MCWHRQLDWKHYEEDFLPYLFTLVLLHSESDISLLIMRNEP